jgi:hypothetical protein
MSEQAPHWRLLLFRLGFTFMVFELALYICGIVLISVIDPLNAKLKVAAWFFVIGSAVSLIALGFGMFGYGRKRLGLAAACVMSFPFWYGLTLY